MKPALCMHENRSFHSLEIVSKIFCYNKQHTSKIKIGNLTLEQYFGPDCKKKLYN